MTDRVIAEPILVPIVDSFNWYLHEDFKVQDDVLGLITVPVNFITDLGSIPRVFWNIVPPEGPATAAYLTHDWLYGKQPCNRQKADECLLRLLAVGGSGVIARYAVYWNLRALGWAAWNSDAKTGPKFFNS